MLQRCPVCGKLFSAGSTRQLYCSTKCREKYKGVVKHGRVHCIVDISIESEAQLDAPPSEAEILSIVSLLKDFGVKDFTDMPTKFDNQRSLRHWKNSEIEKVFTAY